MTEVFMPVVKTVGVCSLLSGHSSHLREVAID